MDLREYFYKVNSLSSEFHDHQITYDEYRQSRKKLMILIDEEINGVKFEGQDDNQEAGLFNDSIITKALSFLKLDNA